MANVTLVVCGGIAAYKACEVMRGLQKAGCDVRVAMTPGIAQPPAMPSAMMYGITEAPCRPNKRMMRSII